MRHRKLQKSHKHEPTQQRVAKAERITKLLKNAKVPDGLRIREITRADNAIARDFTYNEIWRANMHLITNTIIKSKLFMFFQVVLFVVIRYILGSNNPMMPVIFSFVIGPCILYVCVKQYVYKRYFLGHATGDMQTDMYRYWNRTGSVPTMKFWIAEVNSKVIGCVAVRPYNVDNVPEDPDCEMENDNVDMENGGDVDIINANVDTTNANVDTTNANVDTKNANVDTKNANVDTNKADVGTKNTDIDTKHADVDTFNHDSVDTKNTDLVPNPDIAILERLYVADEFRRKGIGMYLVLYALTFCKENNMKEVQVKMALVRPEAQNLFKKLGFTLYKTTEWFRGYVNVVDFKITL